MKRQIVKNLFSNYLLNALGMAMGFALVPFLTAKLGKEAFGLVVLCESTLVFFEVVSVSLRVALARFATFALARDESAEFAEFLSTGRVLLLAAAALIFCLSLVLSFRFDRFFLVPPRYAAESRALYFMIAIGFCGAIPSMVYWSVLYAKNRYDLLNLASASGVMLRGAFLFAALGFLPHAVSPLIVYGAAYLLLVGAQNGAVYLWHRRVLPGLRIRGRFNAERARQMLAYGGSVALARASPMLNSTASNVLINLFWGSAANAVFAIAFKFPGLLSRVFEESAWALTSTFNRLVAVDRKEAVGTLFYLYTKGMALAVGPLCFLLMFAARPLILYWVGPQFAAAAALVPILALPLFVQLPIAVSGCVVNSYGRVKWPALVSLIVAVCNLSLGVFLGKGLGLGLEGIAIASAAVSLAYSAGFTPYYTCKLAGLPVLDYVAKSLLAPLACAFALVAGLWFGCRWFSCKFLLTLPVWLPAYAAAGYWLVLDRRERETLSPLWARLRAELLSLREQKL